jgi:hypothetical protein
VIAIIVIRKKRKKASADLYENYWYFRNVLKKPI